jgi:hypothetical protein
MLRFIKLIMLMDILIDFDGTCVTHDSHNFPKVGKDIGAVPVLKELVSKGHRLILFTMRGTHTGDDVKSPITGSPTPNGGLKEALAWFEENDIPLYGVQTNPTQAEWTNSPKAYGQLMIDDTALGAPLKYDPSMCDRPFIDWQEAYFYLKATGVL